ncbi:MAG: hypothetical protein RR239_00955, partial [Oscillospiraceae bacterium]
QRRICFIGARPIDFLVLFPFDFVLFALQQYNIQLTASKPRQTKKSHDNFIKRVGGFNIRSLFI